jgi:hypothetical protein
MPYTFNRDTGDLVALDGSTVRLCGDRADIVAEIMEARNHSAERAERLLSETASLCQRGNLRSISEIERRVVSVKEAAWTVTLCNILLDAIVRQCARPEGDNHE